jgi:hypothetical protein
MSGGLMQLVAYGAQDIYLTGNPQITFFKIVYKRHTNFAMEAIEQTVSGNISFGSSLTSTIAKNGDLITKMYIKCDVSLSGTGGKFAWINKLGHALLDEVELLIGGTRIDKQYYGWLNLWYELARNTSHNRGYDMMIGNNSDMTKLSTSTKANTLYIPLQFFCNKFNGLAIPIIALQYHDIRIDFKLKSSSELIVKESVTTTTATISNISLLCNYVFLDSEERKRFASSAHEYLIEQTQSDLNEKVDGSNTIYNLNFSHPCKSLYWYMQNGNFISGKSFLNYEPDSSYIYRSGYADVNVDLINNATIRYVLSQMYSNAGVVALSLNGSGTGTASSQTTATTYNHHSITAGTAIIKANYDSLTSIDNTANTANCSATDVANWEVVTALTIDNISTPISTLMNGITRTTDTTNRGHSNYDIVVYQWNNYGKFIDGSVNPITTSLLKLNGHERFSEQSGEFFNYLQAYETHKSTPKDGINLYSFAINPLEHQPSGTCNFSRIDNATLNLTFDSDVTSISDNKLSIFTMNYNILRVMSGLAGMAYSN